MLQIRNLTITHRKDLRIILEKFNMALNDGDKAVIIGEEGNGKSTLMKWIYNPELAEDYSECEGERVTSGEVLGYLPQELPEADKAKTLYEYFSEAQFLNMVVDDMKTKGITPIYLVTDHIGFYERYGWEFLCMAQGDGEPEPTRLYIHR